MSTVFLSLDQEYFDDITLSIDAKDSSKNSAQHHIDRHFTVLPMIMDPASVGQNVAPQIDRQLADYLAKQPLQIDKVWGALEAKTAKALRPLLQKRRSALYYKKDWGLSVAMWWSRYIGDMTKSQTRTGLGQS